MPGSPDAKRRAARAARKHRCGFCSKFMGDFSSLATHFVQSHDIDVVSLLRISSEVDVIVFERPAAADVPGSKPTIKSLASTDNPQACQQISETVDRHRRYFRARSASLPDALTPIVLHRGKIVPVYRCTAVRGGTCPAGKGAGRRVVWSEVGPLTPSQGPDAPTNCPLSPSSNPLPARPRPPPFPATSAKPEEELSLEATLSRFLPARPSPPPSPATSAKPEEELSLEATLSRLELACPKLPSLDPAKLPPEDASNASDSEGEEDFSFALSPMTPLRQGPEAWAGHLFGRPVAPAAAPTPAVAVRGKRAAPAAASPPLPAAPAKRPHPEPDAAADPAGGGPPAAYIGRHVWKKFLPLSGRGPERFYEGRVVGWRDGVAPWGTLYEVSYLDGDGEEVSIEELSSMLVWPGKRRALPGTGVGRKDREKRRVADLWAEARAWGGIELLAAAVVEGWVQ